MGRIEVSYMSNEGGRMYEVGEKREIFSSRVRAGSRTYYFDIKKNSKEDNYLVISESKKTRDENEKQRHRIMVFEEDIEKFSNSFFQVVSYFLENSVNISGDELDKMNETFDDVLSQLKSLARRW